MPNATLTRIASPKPGGEGHPLNFDDLESKRLDCLIAKLRMGQINNVVMRHLEVDGVLQLDPLFELAKCDDGQSSNPAGA